MNYTITTTIQESLYNFLNKEAKEKNITKKSIIEKGLKYYKKYELEKQVKNGFKERYDEYKNINSDFSEVQFNSLKK